MTPAKSPTIAFFGWNPFQLIHVRKLLKACPGAVFVMEKRAQVEEEFDRDLVGDLDISILYWPERSLDLLDGVFDVIVVQTPSKLIGHFTKSRLAMIQYGYAKEPHNYGAWRSFADLNLAYGPYAAAKISHFSPVEAVGNPRFDDWFDDRWRQSISRKFAPQLNPRLPTISYAPTWGDLSSVEFFIDAICALSDKYNVLLKMHHNMDLMGDERKRLFYRENVHVYGADVDLFEILSVSDLLISDYSGAIFDALFCEVPIVLLNLKFDAGMGPKLDPYSLEFARRGEIGLEVNAPAELAPAVERTLSEHPLRAANTAMRQELFICEPGATERALAALNHLAAGQYQQGQLQGYIRKELKTLYNLDGAKTLKAVIGVNEKRWMSFLLLQVLPRLGLGSFGAKTFDKKTSRPTLRNLRRAATLAQNANATDLVVRLATKAAVLYPNNPYGRELLDKFPQSSSDTDDGDKEVSGDRVTSEPSLGSSAVATLPADDVANADLSALAVLEVESRRLVDANPRDWFGYGLLVTVLLHLKRAPEALAILKRVPDVLKTEQNYYIALASAFAANKDHVAAFKTLRQVSAANPSNYAVLTKIAEFYSFDGQVERASVFLKAAQRVRPTAGTIKLLTTLVDRGQLDEAEACLDLVTEMTEPVRNRFFAQLDRISPLFPARSEAFRAWREEARQKFSATPIPSRLQLDTLVRMGAKSRWFAEVEALLRRVRTLGVQPSPFAAGWLNVITTRLGPLADLVPHATTNETADAPIGIRNGEVRPLRPEEVDHAVEFFIPSVFFASLSEEKPSYETVRQFFRYLAGYLLTQTDFFVIPRHQFNWRHAVPRYSQRAVSYHTSDAAGKRRLHIQEAPLAGSCTMDAKGFAGFSETATDFRRIEAAVKDVPVETLEATLAGLKAQFVDGNISKYAQTPADEVKISGRYVFVALQMPTDVVASLAFVDGIDLMRTVVDHYAGSDVTVVVKRHPYCNSMSVQREIERLAAAGQIVVTQGSIHALISGAEAVFAVNSGVGLEALMHMKPVVVTGECDYAYAVACKATSIEDLRAALQTGLTLPRQKILEFLHFYRHVQAIPSEEAAVHAAMADWCRRMVN